MTNILLLIIIGYLAYKEIKERTSFKGKLILEPPKVTETRYFKEISKEELKEQDLQKEFNDLMSYKIDDAINYYKRGGN